MNYTNQLDVKEASKLMKDSGSIWKAAEMDFTDTDEIDMDAYLQKIAVSSEMYMRNQNLICDREDIAHQLDSICSKKGKFAFLTGGPSIGKTLLLNRLTKMNDDGRQRWAVE